MISKLAALVLVAALGAGLIARADSTSDAIAKATAAIQAAVPRAQADPAHPSFHVTSPAQWINDPNGPIFHHGYYHLFYQLSPFSDSGGPKYWGHVRSRDLVKWEPLPIALCPSPELGEAQVWSGCCTINGLGEPMIFYTSIAKGKSPQNHAEQWAAIGDADLITWRKSPANPVLSEALHGDRKVYDWRDPFIFRDHDRTFLVTGGNLNEAKGGAAVINIYEAQNPALTNWVYRGVLFQLPDPKARTAECPNFFKLGNKWVLFTSPYGKVQYFVGDFDATTCRFHSTVSGVLDSEPNFYAPNTMQLPEGRRLVWGWVNGFPNGHGWNGCLSLPRELSLGKYDQLIQTPAPELKKLRGEPLSLRKVVLENSSHVFALPPTNTFEIDVEIEYGTNTVSVGLQNGSAAKPLFVLNLVGSTPIPKSQSKNRAHVRLFLDHSVLEVFADDSPTDTRVILPSADPYTLVITAKDGKATIKRFDAWPLRTIW